MTTKAGTGRGTCDGKKEAFWRQMIEGRAGVALGRKNRLFCGSDNGGATAAVFFSLIATCQKHKVDPLNRYICDPDIPGASPKAVVSRSGVAAQRPNAQSKELS